MAGSVHTLSSTERSLPGKTPSLLAPYEGRRPPAPDWFRAALAQAPERTRTPVAGADIETLAWGERGRPGLLLLHGKMAHADWWSYTAPMLADERRVAACSFGGMGDSGWRAEYALDTMVDEAMAVAEATGLFDGPVPPVVVGHSFGGFVGLRLAQRHGRRWAGLVVIDTPLMTAAQRAARSSRSLREREADRPTRIYADEAQALARFRLQPPQPCDRPYVADHIARLSLRRVDGGWTWRFDPRVAAVGPGHAAESLRAAACPVALLWGEDSELASPDIIDHMRGLLPPGAPAVGIPAARHHVMIDQPLALVAALRGLLAGWP